MNIVQVNSAIFRYLHTSNESFYAESENKTKLQAVWDLYAKGAFKYYVIKEVGGWGQKMAIFDDLLYCKSSKRLMGGPKKVKNMMT